VPPEPDRTATRVTLLPLLPSGPDGVHRGQPCGARPGRPGFHRSGNWEKLVVQLVTCAPVSL